MLKLKACPRCEGDLHINRDMYGPYRQCLQCGYMRDIPQTNRLLKSLELADFNKSTPPQLEEEEGGLNRYRSAEVKATIGASKTRLSVADQDLQ